jgi:hypothetical protein
LKLRKHGYLPAKSTALTLSKSTDLMDSVESDNSYVDNLNVQSLVSLIDFCLILIAEVD